MLTGSDGQCDNENVWCSRRQFAPKSLITVDLNPPNATQERAVISRPNPTMDRPNPRVTFDLWGDGGSVIADTAEMGLHVDRSA